ncbi:hypothetical protein A7E78_03285 [Syntrophotalea acetylenivorans]|uniref:Glycosyl transferase family 1 domain-containing protein n=1 Tax=Syntrophotalea acetylenivorans TaxID=1842532 RepID=A0A1L3GM23_9BACT|nr:glycosyltransferase family 4 protein [Syntrophotalea acetylenivorans]APG26940.1 hypothetical protein A7E78_03285 [Syntrophotalea acetylenivorans]
MTLKICVIGTLPPPVGGTSVSLKHLVSSLQSRDDVRVRVINTGGIRSTGFKAIRQFLRTVFEIFRCVRDVDVVTLHVGLGALPLIGPFVYTACRWSKKPFLIRRFGGNDHRELKGLKGFVGEWVIRRANLYLVQTRVLQQGAKDAGLERVEWFPTSRPLPGTFSDCSGGRAKCRRFVFLGHVRPTKGIPELIAAAERFDDSVSVNVYGPFYDGLKEDVFNQCKRVSYCGVAEPDRVPEILQNHDALILPTYYVGEGYPGVILEAFNAGIPVITTIWKAIPEIVDETCGILIPPQDADSLYNAMSDMVVDGAMYQTLCHGVQNRRALFDFEKWTDRFVSYCMHTNTSFRKSHKMPQER